MGGVEYAIAGNYREFMAWRKKKLGERRSVIYLTADQAGQYSEKGVLHRVGNWEQSPALEIGLALEAKG